MSRQFISPQTLNLHLHWEQTNYVEVSRLKTEVSNPSRLKLHVSSIGKNPGSVFALLNRILRLPAVTRARKRGNMKLYINIDWNGEAKVFKDERLARENASEDDSYQRTYIVEENDWYDLQSEESKKRAAYSQYVDNQIKEGKHG